MNKTLFTYIKNIKNTMINLTFVKFIFLFSFFNIIVYGYPIITKANTFYHNFFITIILYSISYALLISAFSILIFKKSYKLILSFIILKNVFSDLNDVSEENENVIIFVVEDIEIMLPKKKLSMVDQPSSKPIL